MSSAPRTLPSSLNWTPTTPTSSEASADTGIVPLTDAELSGLVMATVGEATSWTLFTVTWMGAEVVALPAASRARAVMTCGPLAMVVVSQVRL